MPPSATDQLAEGNVLVHAENLYIVESFHGGSVSVGILGNRKVEPSLMFNLEDDCPAPGCTGTVTESGPGERTCSEGCLEWHLNHRTDGEDCPSMNCDDGEVIDEHERGNKYSLRCTECQRFAFGPEYWRETWRSHARESAINTVQAEADTDV